MSQVQRRAMSQVQRIYPPKSGPLPQITHATLDIALQNVPAGRWVIYEDPEIGGFGVYPWNELDEGKRGSWINISMIVRTSEDSDAGNVL